VPDASWAIRLSGAELWAVLKYAVLGAISNGGRCEPIVGI
jgi:hypothetical protein